MTWVVTGGAGYIGAHVVRALQEEGMAVAVVDDLSTGHVEFLPVGTPFLHADVNETDRLSSFLADEGAVGVIHVAGYKFAGESVQSPLHTYRINVQGTVSVLEAMRRAQVLDIVFSSSAAVYGTPDIDQVTEDTPTAPESPYGESKVIGEWLLADQARATGLRHTSLRYFNVVGSGDPLLSDTSPHNLIPLVFSALERGVQPRVFGTDHPTPDGTCVRDYVHVADIARAHVAAAQVLEAGGSVAPVYNLGSGRGTSVHEIMEAVRTVTGRDLDPHLDPRRPGDPARIVANGALAAQDLGWENTHTVEDMVRTAWAARRAAQFD